MHALLLASLTLMMGIAYLMYNNNYLRFNPQYEKTISHQRFDKLLTATYKMEDISTMERLYRWVAGVQMIQDKPLWVLDRVLFILLTELTQSQVFKLM